MNQQQIDDMIYALKEQGLDWAQINFAVSLVRNGAAAERESWINWCATMSAITYGQSLTLEGDAIEKSRLVNAAIAKRRAERWS